MIKSYHKTKRSILQSLHGYMRSMQHTVVCEQSTQSRRATNNKSADIHLTCIVDSVISRVLMVDDMIEHCWTAAPLIGRGKGKGSYRFINTPLIHDRTIWSSMTLWLIRRIMHVMMRIGIYM